MSVSPYEMQVAMAALQGGSVPDSAGPEVTPLEPMDDGELIDALEYERRQSIGWWDTEVTDNRQKALDYYYGRLPGPGDDGCSAIVSRDVQSIVDATVAEVSPMFRNDNLISLAPLGPNDEEQAEQESRGVNHILFEMNDGHVILSNAVFDACLQRNVVAQVRVDDTPSVEYEEISGLTPWTAVQVLQPKAPGQKVEVVEHWEEEPQQQHPQQLMGMAPGFGPGMAQGLPPTGPTMGAMPTLGVRVRRESPCRKILVEGVPLEEFLVNSDLDTLDLQKARYVARHRKASVNELTLLGVPEDVIDTLDDFNWTERERYTQSSWTGDYNTGDESNRLLDVVDSYYRVDYDGDGVAELRRVLYSSNTVLLNEPVGLIPFVSGAASIMPHQWVGVSLADKNFEIQDAKTAFLRQAIDNGRIANNSGLIVVDGEVEPDDVLTSRPGRIIRADTINSVAPIPHNDTSQASLGLLGYLDKARSERGANALDMSTSNMKVGMQTAHGVERQMSTMELIGAQIATNLAETFVRPLGKLIHEVARRNIEKPIQITTRAGWSTVQPKMWQRRERVDVMMGASRGEQTRTSQALSLVMQQQTEAMQGGMAMVTPDNLHNSRTDFAKAAGLEDPSKYWIDPQSPEGRQMAQQQAQQAQQAQQQQMEQMQLQMQLQKAVADAELQKSQAQMYSSKVKGLEAQIKALNDQGSQTLDRAKLAQDQAQHLDQMEYDYTALEVQEQQNVPGSRV